MFGINFTTKRETAQDEAPANPTQHLPTHWFVETVFGDRALALDCHEVNGQWKYTLAHVEKRWGEYYASPNTFFAYESEITDARQFPVKIVGV